MIKISTNNPTSVESMVLESSVKPNLDYQTVSHGLVSQKIQEPLTIGANLFRVVRVKGVCTAVGDNSIFRV